MHAAANRMTNVRRATTERLKSLELASMLFQYQALLPRNRRALGSGRHRCWLWAPQALLNVLEASVRVKMSRLAATVPGQPILRVLSSAKSCSHAAPVTYKNL